MRVACIWFEAPTATHKLAELFLKYSPQICIRKDQSIFVEIGKCHKLYSEQDFFDETYLLMKQYGFDVTIKISSEITSSLALAKYKKSYIDDLPLTSLLEFADPFDRDPFLQKSVSNMITSFKDLGVQSIGDFKVIPISDLVSRFGVLGRHCHHRVNLKDSLIWPLWKPEVNISEKKEFSYFEFCGELEPVLFELKSQLDRIYDRLRARGRWATKIQVVIKCEKMSLNKHLVREFNFDFFTPQTDTKSTIRIFRERLQRNFERQPILSPIECIETIVTETVNASSGQKNLFNNNEDIQEKIGSIHNQLIEMLGAENVFQAELIEDRRPERSWTKQYHSPHSPDVTNTISLNTIPERPTFLLKKPFQIKIKAGFLTIKNKPYRILHWDQNIEIINGGWFEKPSCELSNLYERKYSQVIIEGHNKITVFETPDKKYFIHGYYG